jgi:hypothetical protein
MKFMKFMAETFEATKTSMTDLLNSAGFPESIRQATIAIADKFDTYNGGYGALILVRIAEAIAKTIDAGTLINPFNDKVKFINIKDKTAKEITPALINYIAENISFWTGKNKRDQDATKKILTVHLLKKPSLFDLSENAGDDYIENLIKKALKELNEKNTPANIINIIRDINKKFPLYGGYIVPHMAKLLIPELKNNKDIGALAKKISTWDIYRPGNDNGPTVSAIEKILNRNIKKPSLFDLSESYKNKNPDAVKKMGEKMLGEFPSQVAEAVKALNNKYRFTDYYTAPILSDIANRIIQLTDLGAWQNKNGNYTFIPFKTPDLKSGLTWAAQDISALYSKPLFDTDSPTYAAKQPMNSWTKEIEELLRQYIGKQKLSLFDISEAKSGGQYEKDWADAIKHTGCFDKAFDEMTIKKLKDAKYPDTVNKIVLSIFKEYPGLTDHYSVDVLQEIGKTIIMHTNANVSPEHIREAALDIYTSYIKAFTDKSGRPKQESFKFIRQTIEANLINKKPSLFDI